MLVTLIGYRGTGKSSLAPLLAAAWGWSWIDADVELEARAGRSIAEIFRDAGEPEFRRLERMLLAELLQRDRLVLAAGGGAILRADTRTEMRAAGPVIWLQASVEEIVTRLSGDVANRERRPALSALPLYAEVTEKLRERTPLYAQTATLVIETDGRPPAELALEIQDRLTFDSASASGASSC